MPNIDEWLARKYDILGQQANADEMRAAAANTSAGADVTNAESAAGLRRAQAGFEDQQAKWYGPKTQSDIRLQGAQAGNLESETGARNYATSSAKSWNDAHPDMPSIGGTFANVRDSITPPSAMPPASSPLSPRRQSALSSTLDPLGGWTPPRSVFDSDKSRVNLNIPALKKGTARVTDKSGKGSPYEDTVPAKLADGEAVLNAGAAELMGRDMIEHMNRQGLRHMGLPEHSAMGGFNVSTGNINAATGYVPFNIPGTPDPASAAARVGGIKDILGNLAEIKGKQYADVAGKIAAPLRAAAPAVLKYAGPIGAATSLYNTVSDASEANDKYNNPELATGRIIEGGQRLAGAGLGASLGSALGPAGTLVGGAAGYFAPDLVSKITGRELPSDTIAKLRGRGDAGLLGGQPDVNAPAQAAAPEAPSAQNGLRGQPSADDIAQKNYVLGMQRLAIAGNPAARDYMNNIAREDRTGGSAANLGLLKPNFSIKNVDQKTGKISFEDDKQSNEIYSKTFLPAFLQQNNLDVHRMTPDQLMAVDREAQQSFKLMQAANKINPEKMQFNEPVMPQEYIQDLSMFNAGGPGDNTIMQGLWDKGGIRVRNARGDTKILPVSNLLEDPEAAANPYIQRLMENVKTKKPSGLR